jgi:hypothetical protein
MLTQIERNLLIRVREAIKAEQEWSICVALRDLAFGIEENEAAERLRNYITESLHILPTTLESWQMRMGFRHRSSARTRADRIAWIDWMLDQ